MMESSEHTFVQAYCGSSVYRFSVILSSTRSLHLISRVETSSPAVIDMLRRTRAGQVLRGCCYGDQILFYAAQTRCVERRTGTKIRCRSQILRSDSRNLSGTINRASELYLAKTCIISCWVLRRNIFYEIFFNQFLW